MLSVSKGNHSQVSSRSILSIIFYIIHCYNNLASCTQSQTYSQSQKATIVNPLLGQFICLLLYYLCYNNLAFNIHFETHSQSQKATTVKSPIRQFVCLLLYYSCLYKLASST